MTSIEINPSLFASASNKTVLITGAARGIGAATAALFNQQGANIVLTDLLQFKDIANELISTFTYPDRAIFAPANIVDWSQLSAAFKSGIQRFGEIDIVIANAGIMESSPILDFDIDENGDLKEDEEGGRVIDVNLKGTLNTLRLALFYLQSSQTLSASTTKSIILLGSTSSYFGGTGVTAYVASKHGVLGLLRASQSRAAELGIRVNAIAPFLTPTQITAGFAERWREEGLEENTPGRVASAIAYVSLDESRKGECILVAGSYLREMESSRTKLLPTWIGSDLVDFMARAMQFFVGIGGYVLPKKY
ncbi:uncharacterized protein N7483_003719 [Penicillium malachiteum]|uniref:uncharacterized protein n=1 Tax=Penicillium malachiteum TaxID=1324776 RepID=UPI0025485980|nr:uncharacterized protein N7483_003719 [Penicillium malachiteum]KAJ5729211.1 hypothetical protein N7483_003719 [Penicillium malachiteum]